MKTRFTAKSIIFWVAFVAAIYFMMSHHIIFFGWEPKVLKKSKFTFEETFFSTTGMSNEQILRNETLRRAGVGKLLVEMGRMTQQELESITAQLTE